MFWQNFQIPCVFPDSDFFPGHFPSALGTLVELVVVNSKIFILDIHTMKNAYNSPVILGLGLRSIYYTRNKNLPLKRVKSVSYSSYFQCKCSVKNSTISVHSQPCISANWHGAIMQLKQCTHSNCIFKFPVFSLFFPCPTANFPCDNFNNLCLLHINKTNLADLSSFKRNMEIFTANI